MGFWWNRWIIMFTIQIKPQHTGLSAEMDKIQQLQGVVFAI